MNKPASTSPPGIFDALVAALKGELEQLKSARQTLTLTSGIQVGSFAGRHYYRFEIPEDVLLRSLEQATFAFGTQQPLTSTGNVISIDNQFLTIALPHDFGPMLPEARCSWSYQEHFEPAIERLETASDHIIAQLLLNPADPRNAHAVPIDVTPLPATPPDQTEAVAKIFKNRVTLLWGPIRSGKTHVLALAAANYLKAGRRVLYVSPSNDDTDDTLLKTVEAGKQLGLNMEATVVRTDLPSLTASEALTPYSFEHQIEALREEKRKLFQERITLVRTYRRIKMKQILYEDFYLRVRELREKQSDLRRQIDGASKEVDQLRESVGRIQNASMIERLKKGLGKDDLATAQKQLSDKQVLHKRLQAISQALANEITKWDLNAPVTGEETREFNQAAMRIEELGGLEHVQQAVDEFISVDAAALLKTKLLVATNIQSALMDRNLKDAKFDLVIVDGAQMVNLPTLTALATFAADKMLVAGDPFQLEAETLAANEQSQQLMQRDIYLHAAGRDDLHGLFDWTQQNSQWSILLSAQFASTPKLALFAASVLYDDRINVFITPKARGMIYFVDTSEFGSRCKQYAGRKKILPFNEFHAKRVLECVKHALMEAGRSASDIGVIYPFAGPTLYTRFLLRINAVENVEVGTPLTFRGRRKKAVIFDTTMAGVDYTMRLIDDKKVGEHRIARLFNTLFSSVEEDLYVIADMSHFRQMYKDRLFTRLLMLLQSEADQQQPNFSNSVRKFDDLELLRRAELFQLSKKDAPALAGSVSEPRRDDKVDFELEIKMKMLAKQQSAAKPSASGERNFERDTTAAVRRVLGGRVDANLLSQYVGGDLLFRNSIAAEQATRRLSNDFCTSEKDFREIMERWNLLIYETSGGSKTDLSYFTTKGPETRIRENIRHLKAFYSSDVEAVIEEGKQKIAVEVSKIFTELLGKSQPGNPTEWGNAYLSFLGRLETYLNWISEQLRR